jgi:hypothetical protein
MKKILLNAAKVIGGLLLLILAFVGFMQWAVVQQPVRAPVTQAKDLPTDNPSVYVRIDEGMFTLFAALNAAGYDRENFDLPYSPARQLVREQLNASSFNGQEFLRKRLQTLYPYDLIIWRLHYGQPPEFERVQSGWWDENIPAFAFWGLDAELRNYYINNDIAALWEEVRPMYEEEAALYQQASGRAVQEALDYTRMQDVQLKKYVVIPNLLDAHWSGKGPTVGDVAYMVVGPAEDGKADVGLLQHEALHSIVGELVAANMDAIDTEKGTELYNKLRDRVPSGYGSWESIVEEQVVRAVSCRLSKNTCEAYGLANDEAQGFLLERTLVDKLKEFERSEGTLAEFMPELLRSINGITLP